MWGADWELINPASPRRLLFFLQYNGWADQLQNTRGLCINCFQAGLDVRLPTPEDHSCGPRCGIPRHRPGEGPLTPAERSASMASRAVVRGGGAARGGAAVARGPTRNCTLFWAGSTVGSNPARRALLRLNSTRSARVCIVGTNRQGGASSRPVDMADAMRDAHYCYSPRGWDNGDSDRCAPAAAPAVLHPRHPPPPPSSTHPSPNPKPNPKPSPSPSPNPSPSPSPSPAVEHPRDALRLCAAHGGPARGHAHRGAARARVARDGARRAREARALAPCAARRAPRIRRAAAARGGRACVAPAALLIAHLLVLRGCALPDQGAAGQAAEERAPLVCEDAHPAVLLAQADREARPLPSGPAPNAVVARGREGAGAPSSHHLARTARGMLSRG